MRNPFKKIIVFLVGFSMLNMLPFSATRVAAQTPILPQKTENPNTAYVDAGGLIHEASNQPFSKPLPTRISKQAPMTTGGPDDFGYTWNDSAAYSWVDASAGTNTGLSGSCHANVNVPLGFNFKYYENTYSSVYVSASGYLTFNSNYGGCDYPSGTLPRADYPNVIAPYADYYPPITSGQVRTLQGGAAPNRYFVVEWNHLIDSYQSDGHYTFEAILYENGNIRFQYADMTYSSAGYSCATTGIVDSTGLDGLGYGWCDEVSSNKAIQFTRPAPIARVRINPEQGGGFGKAGTTAQFSLTIHNSGELGTDTYAVSSSSDWPLGLYTNGGAPLTDTNGDGKIDTGAVSQGGDKIIVAKIDIPMYAAVGDSGLAQITLTSGLDSNQSRTADLRVSIPAAFAQSYYQSGRTYADFIDATRATILQTSPTYNAYTPVIATTPTGNLVHAWEQEHYNSKNVWVGELYYRVTDASGADLLPPTRLTNNDTATVNTYDEVPAIAIAPNGQIGLVWEKYAYRSNPSSNMENIYFMILNPDGGLALAPVNITNTSWYTYTNSPGFRGVYGPNLAVSPDNHFTLAWERDDYTGSGYNDVIWYATYTSAGKLKAPTQFSADTCSYTPVLTSSGGWQHAAHAVELRRAGIWPPGQRWEYPHPPG